MKLLSLLLTLFFVISCAKEKSVEKANVLNWALTSSVSTLDPAVSYDTVSSKVVSQVYESLYEYDYLIRPYQLKPLLAKDLPVISDNGLKYTIKLKKNIKYHDSKAFSGKKVTVKAQDFINQIKRVAFQGTKSNGWWLFKNRIEGLDEFREKAKYDFSKFHELKVSGLIAKDDHTLVIKLVKPYPQLKYALAMPFSSPIPKQLVDFYKNDLNHEPVGTGPYKFISWNKGYSIKLEKFADYHKEFYPTNGDRLSYERKLLEDRGQRLPFIEKVNFYIIKEAQTRWLKFLNKELDVIVLSRDHYEVALGTDGMLKEEYTKDGIMLQVAPTLTYWWLAFNMSHEFIGNNINFRKAIAHAVNIDEYIAKFTHNISLRANSIYPPGVQGYTPGNKLAYDYNVEKAKEYLAKAGYPNGKGLPTFNYDLRSTSSVARKMGEFIKIELAKIGVNINLITNAFPAFLNKARTGQLEIWQGGWAMDYPDPENVIQLLISKNHSPGPNSTFYSNKDVDALYEKLFNNSSDVLDITEKVEKIVAEEVPWVMQFYSRNYILQHGHVKNFRQSDLVNNNFKYLRIK